MIKNKLFSLLAVLVLPLVASAQTVSGGGLPPLTPVEKHVYDTAHAKIYYEYAFRCDSAKTDKFTRGQTVLLVGDAYTCFIDNQALLRDSLTDAFCREGKSPMEYMAKFMSLENPVYEYSLMSDIKSGEVSVLFDSSSLKLQYVQPKPKLAWTLAAGDSVVSGVKCKKAVCRFGGRDWTAWYSPEYGLPLGPYMFGGLPGLIFAVGDGRGDHVFTLNGVELCRGVVQVYQRADDGIIKLPRDKARETIRKYYEDSSNFILMKYPGTMLPDDLQGKKLSAPYNPIELE